MSVSTYLSVTLNLVVEAVATADLSELRKNVGGQVIGQSSLFINKVQNGVNR